MEQSCYQHCQFTTKAFQRSIVCQRARLPNTLVIIFHRSVTALARDVWRQTDR